jgi:hypothetical protein
MEGSDLVQITKTPLSIRSLLYQYRHPLILMLIIISSSFFIFVGIDWGLPAYLHPDEGTIVNSAIKMVQNRSFEPDVFYRPDHLLIQINMLLYRILIYLYDVSIANMNSIGIETFYLTARIITGVFAVASIIVGYLIGKNYSNNAGLASAFLFAFFPRYITHSHYATPDIPSTFFMLLFIYSALSYMQKSNYANLVFMSLITAAFITIKYPGAILCLMIAVSVIACSLSEKKVLKIFTHGISAVCLVLTFIFLISPVLVLKFSNVRQAFVNEARSTHLGADGLGVVGNVMFYFNNYLSASGIILLVFLGFGFFSLLSKKQSVLKNIPIFYSFIFTICISCMPLHWERWGLPMHVSPLLVSAIGVSNAYEIFATNKSLSSAKKQKLRTIFTVAVCLSFINLILSSYGDMITFLLPDTRIVSLEYCEENGINGNNTAVESYTTVGIGAAESIPGIFEEVDGVYYLNKNRVENVIISSGMYGRYKAEPDRYSHMVALYDSLDNHYINRERFASIEDQYAELRRFNDSPRGSSIIEVINIYHSIIHIIRAQNHGVAGPTLIFYEADSSNYIPYVFSNPIYFADEHKSYDRYYIRGLSTQEDRGVWTSGNETEFLFYLPDTHNDLKFTFDVTPLVGSRISSQIVEVVTNGQSLGSLTIKETGVHDVVIPNGIIEGNRLNLKLLLHTATSPKELKINDDERILALFFSEMSINEIT